MAKNNDDDLLEDDAQFKDEYELNLEEEDALLALNDDEVSTSEGCGDRSGEVEYVDEEGNPVSVHEGRSLEVVAVHEDYGYGSHEADNDEGDILEVGIDPEFDALGQETEEFDSPRNVQERGCDRTSQRVAHSPSSSRASSTASPCHPSTPNTRTEGSEKGFGQKDARGASGDAANVADNYEEGQGVDDDEDDDEDGEERRTRFRAERRGESSATSAGAKRREEIPDSLDAVISPEDAAKVDAYLSREEERKRNRRGGMARGVGSFRKRGHRGAGGNKPLQPHIDPWMPHSGPLAMQQGRFHSPNLGGPPQRRFPPGPCMNDNMRAKIFVNPQFHNGNMPPGGPRLHNDGVAMGRPPHFQQMNHPHQQVGLFQMRQESFPFMRPPVPSRPEQRVPPFSQSPGDGRGFQRPPHASPTTYANNGPHSLAPAQFSTAIDRFMPSSRPGLEPFDMPPPHIDFGPGRNGEFPPRRDVDPWVHPGGSGHHGIAPGARQQSQPFGSPPHYTSASLQPPQQQHHMSSPVPAHPFPSVSQHQHCPPPQISQSANQPSQEQHYQSRPPPHFQQQQQQQHGGPPQMMHASHPPPPHPPHHHGPPPRMQPPPSLQTSSPGGAFGHPQFQQHSPRLGDRCGVTLRKRASPSEGTGQGPLLPCPQPKVGRIDSPRSSRASMGRTVNSSNIKEVPIVENLPPPEPVKVSLPKEVEEDSATLELRRKIEEQKKLREQVLRIKAERRKLAAMQRQRDVMEKNLHSNMGDAAQMTENTAVVAAATITPAPTKQQVPPVQRIQLPEKPTVSVKQRLGLNPNVQQGIESPGGAQMKKVVIVRRNPSQQQAIQQQQKQPTRNVISLIPQGRAVRHPLQGRGGIISAAGRGAGRSVLRPTLPLQQQQQPQCSQGAAKKVIKIVPCTAAKGRAQAPSVRGGGGDIAQRIGIQGGQQPPTTQVLVNNLSASTTEAQLKQLGSTCGVITGIVLDRNQRRAVIGFQDPQQAFTFQKKYQRHMLDLSMIQVSLLPP